MAQDSPQEDGDVAVVLGTRPEMVKLAETIRLLGPRAFVVSTGQHYTPAMAEAIWTGLGLPDPDASLDIGGVSRGSQLGNMVAALDDLFVRRRPQAVLVQGDTNSALAGALAANAMSIPLVHVEAGLRSFDRTMPEEHNRVLIDHLSDLCCAPTSVSRDNLAAEGIEGERVVVTGNTVVEAVLAALPLPAVREALLTELGLNRGGYVLATFHRPENVDDSYVLRTILNELRRLPLPVVLPLHPRTRARLEAAGLGESAADLVLIDPVEYPRFLALAAEAALLVSDSGGIQEEATVLKRPVVVVRATTERPEILGTFGTLVPAGPQVGATIRAWLADIEDRHLRLSSIESPYGDGTASAAIVKVLHELAPDRR